MHTLAVRLPPGTDLRDALKQLTTEHAFSAACIVTCVGSLAQARLRMPGTNGEEEIVRSYDEPMEIISLAGTLSPDGSHLHLSLSRRDGGCIGGHLMPGCLVRTTAELVIGVLDDLEFRRMPDETTGYHELVVRPRR
jgi:predicted DNA-binding protein with PD1-like motif